MIYLPHAVPSLASLERILIYIWSIVATEGYMGSADENKYVHERVTAMIDGKVSPPDVTAFTALEGVTPKQSAVWHRALYKGASCTARDSLTCLH